MRSLYFLPLVINAVALQACAQSTAQPPAPAAAAVQTEQQPAAAADPTPPPMKPAPKLSDAEMEAFLKMAPIVSKEALASGTTGSLKATLSDGKLTHDVHIQCMDIYRPVWKGAEGTVEKNFRDSWKFNIAAYRLARLLQIDDMVPMSVERTIEGKQCSVTWWVDNIWLVEVERRDKGIKPPATDRWVNQLNTIRVFDQLIYNTDRNQGNLLITPEWRVWMIDHTRAFRTQKTLLRPETLKRIDNGLLERLRRLNTVDLKRELGPWLRAEEIAAILPRRDEIVRFFEKEVRVKGEEAVLTGIPRKTPHVTLP
jgi:hypothetical protein